MQSPPLHQSQDFPWYPSAWQTQEPSGSAEKGSGQDLRMGRAAPVPGEQPPHPRQPTSPGQHHLGKGRACLPAGSNGRMAWWQGRRKAEEVTEAAGGFGGPDVGAARESCGAGMWLPPHSSRRGEHSQPPQHVGLHCRHRNRQGVGTSPVESVGAGAAVGGGYVTARPARL